MRLMLWPNNGQAGAGRQTRPRRLLLPEPASVADILVKNDRATSTTSSNFRRKGKWSIQFLKNA
jgi:hypothetical protein